MGMRWHETAYLLGIGSFPSLLIFDDLFLSLLPGRQWFCLQIGWLLLQSRATVSRLQLAAAQLHCFNLAQVSLNTNKDSCTMSDIHWQKGVIRNAGHGDTRYSNEEIDAIF